MGLTITATFEEQGIYFAGETLECHIRIANVRSLSTSRPAPLVYHASTHAVVNTKSQYPPSSRKSTGRMAYQRVVSGASNSERPVFGEAAYFPSLDNNSEYSSGSAALHGLVGTRRYSAIAGTREGSTGNNSSHKPIAINAKKQSKPSERDSINGGLGIHTQSRKTGLAAFPVLGEGSPASADLSLRLDTHKLYRGSTGAYDERSTQDKQSPAPSRKPQNSTATQSSIVTSPVDGTNHPPRLSTSSILSTPTSSFTSWLPFGSKKQQQQQQLGIGQILRQPTRANPVDASASDAGSSGLLSSLWRNLSGGSNPPSRPATRTGTMVEEDIGIERLAIGFAEASGSLTLATPYIKPEQMELLLIHKGTDFTSGSGISSPPIGGGLGSWVPAGSSNQIAGRSHKTLPLLISSPTVLFSELALAPGESQTFSLRVLLPKSLPPSFRGRTASISYDLVVVAKRNMLDSSAYVVRIPFRVLAHVNSLGALETFKFAQPIRMLPDHMKLTYQESTSISTPRNASPSLSSEGDELPRPASGNSETLNMEEFLPSLSSLGKTKENTDDVCEQLAKSPFLQSLLASIDSEMDSDAQIVPSMELDSHSTTSQSTSQTKSNTINDNDSKHNIQAICRKRAPVSFSLSQGNHTVASVWLPKRVYQLGDMVTGKLELHLGLVSVYQVSIWLESVETVSENFANYNPGRTEELTRRIYAEHHEFCRGTRTLGFSLTSLPVAAASFSSSLMSNIWQLRIELIIGVSSGSSACDFALSAATPFPPAKSHHSSIGGSESRSAALTVSSQITSSTIPNHNAATGQPRLLKADIPLIASKHAGFDTNKNRGGRIRSSTIIGSSGLPQSIHQHYHHGHNNHNQQHSLHQTPDGKLKEVQPQPRVSTEDIPRTVRRRYDVISSMPTQTLSCTVSIQMHPPPSKTSPPGHKDTYTSDLIMQR